MTSKRNGPIHEVTRKDAFSEVPHLIEQAIDECPLRVRFRGEMGYDTGGVCREMLSCFWEEAYKCAFDGSTLLLPILHPHLDVSVLRQVGMVLSHGYLVSSVFPIRIAFPVLAYVLLGFEISIPVDMFIQSFIDSLSSFENGIIKDTLERTGAIAQSATIVEILSRYGCRSIPKTSDELRRLVIGICRYNFHDKPMAVMRAMREGIPSLELPFWSGHSVKDLNCLYTSLCASPQRVLSSLNEPNELDMNQARVFEYLKQLIGNMGGDSLRRFLRFTTGSSVLFNNRISVTFNSLSGLARRPIAHTCDSIIELPSTYVTYPEFEREFTAVLADDDHAWQMDSV